MRNTGKRHTAQANEAEEQEEEDGRDDRDDEEEREMSKGTDQRQGTQGESDDRTADDSTSKQDSSTDSHYPEEWSGGRYPLLVLLRLLTSTIPCPPRWWQERSRRLQAFPPHDEYEEDQPLR